MWQYNEKQFWQCDSSVTFREMAQIQKNDKWSYIRSCKKPFLD